MSTSPQDPQAGAPHSEPELFSFGKNADEKQSRRWMPWAVAATVVMVGLGLLAFFGGSHPPASTAPNAALQPSAYASSLQLTGLQVSQATNFAGGQVTYVDGNISNHGNQTVSGVTVAVTFPNDAGEQPQVETIPLALIRAHEPYVDTEPVSVAPLAPGDTHEFRLIFDNVSSMWNQQVPQIQIMGVKTGSPSK